MNMYGVAQYQENIFSQEPYASNPLEVLNYFKQTYQCDDAQAVEIFNAYYDSMLEAVDENSEYLVTVQNNIYGSRCSKFNIEIIDGEYSFVEEYEFIDEQCEKDVQNNKDYYESLGYEIIVDDDGKTYLRQTTKELYLDSISLFQSINNEINDRDVYAKKAIEAYDLNNETSFNDLCEEYNEAYNSAYGKNELSQKIEEYMTDMDSYSSKLSTCIAMIGFVGSFIPGMQWMTWVSLAGAATDNVIDLANLATNKVDGEFGEWFTQTAYETFNMAIGMKLGAWANKQGAKVAYKLLQNNGMSANTAHMIGIGAEYVLDAGSGFAWDVGMSYLTTGDWNTKGNLLSNLLFASADFKAGVALYRSMKIGDYIKISDSVEYKYNADGTMDYKFNDAAEIINKSGEVMFRYDDAEYPVQSFDGREITFLKDGMTYTYNIETNITKLPSDFSTIDIDDLDVRDTIDVEDVIIKDAATELAEAGVDSRYIKDLVTTLDDVQIDNAIKLAEAGVSSCHIKNLAILEGAQLDAAIKLAEAGVNSYDIKDIITLESTQIDNAIKLAEAGVSSYHIKNLAILESTQIDSAIKLVKAGVDSCNIKDLATLESTQVDNLIKLIEAGVDSRYIGDFATLEGVQFDNAIKLVKAGVSSYHIKDLAILEGAQLDNTIKLYKAGIDIYALMDCMKYDCDEATFKNKLKCLENPDVILLATKYNLTDVLSLQYMYCFSEEQIRNLVSFMENLNLPTAQYTTELKKLQNDAGFLLSINTEELNIETEETKRLYFNISVSEDGKPVYTRTEISGDEVLTWNKDSNKSVYLYGVGEYSTLREQLDIYGNENGEPDYILYTKESQILPGTYDTIKYRLLDYPEEMDVIQAIKDGTISGGEVLTKSTINPDGSISYVEKYQQNDTTTNRTYFSSMDESGNVSESKYSYEIVDLDGNKLMSVNRGWTRNGDGSTITIVNDKEYRTTFDDKTRVITITDEQGKQIEMNFNDMFNETPDADVVKQMDLDTSPESSAQMWEFFKTLPADTLIDINDNTDTIYKLKEPEDSACGENELFIGTDQSIVAHEVGHSIESKIIENPALIDVYNQEMESFRHNFTSENGKIISYFSLLGGGITNTGLSETIAETNMLLTTYGHSMDGVATRAMYLPRYFPKTIAKIAELLKH